MLIVLAACFVVPIALVPFLCAGRRGTFAYRVGQLVNLAALLGTLAALYYLISAGNKARWSSEGAGILFIFLLILMLGLLALVLGGLFLRYLMRSDDWSDEDRAASLRTGVAVLVVVTVAGGIAYAALSSAIGRHSHDDDVVNVFLSGDESEVFSVDYSRTLKRWDARSGWYQGTVDNRGLGTSPVSFGARGGVLLPYYEFARKDYFLYPGSGVDDLGSGSQLNTASAALTPDGEVVTVRGDSLEWRPIATPHGRGRELRLRQILQEVAVSAGGEVAVVGKDGRLVTLVGNPPQVKRELDLPPRKYSRLAFFPSGSALLAVDERGGAVVVLESGETHELPEDANLELFAFIGPDSLVYGRTGLTRLSVPGLESRPFTGPTPRMTSLAGSPRHGRAYFASGADVYLVGERFWNREGEASVDRLRHWRLGDAKPRRRRY